MNLFGQLGSLKIMSGVFLTSGIMSALFGQPDFGLILVAISAILAYVYQTAWQRGRVVPQKYISHWQRGRFTAGQQVLHFGREAYVLAAPIRIVPRNHVPVTYTDESGCFATVPWSELQYPRHVRVN